MLEYTYRYNTQYTPSAPFVDVKLSTSPHSKQVIEAYAQIDTGSDVSAIPLTLLNQIGAGKQREQQMVGMNGRPERVEIFELFITIADQRIAVDVIGLSHLQEVVIGRDVLNHFTLVIDGLSQTTSIPVG